MISHDDWSRLARFASAECSAEEAEACARWINESAERQEALAFIRDANLAAARGRPAWDTAAAWERLAVRQSTRAGGRPSPPRLQLTPVTRRAARWSRRLAAAVVIAAGAAGAAWELWHGSAGQLADRVSVQGPMRERVTARGERTTFHLPDGSLVILAPASRLRYPTSFATRSGRRDVYLEGQALFEVRHNARRPFFVHTVGGLTEDLGTRFTVQEYPGDTAVQVVVAQGSVELRGVGPARSGVVLQPGQLGQLSRNGDAVVRSNVDLGRQLAWTEGRLAFNDTPLRDALPVLSRWYGVEFALGDRAIGNRHLSGIVAAGEIAETLEMLSSTLDLEYERRAGVITFSPRR